MQDEVLRRAYEKHRTDQDFWANVSAYFTRIQAKACSARWYTVLNPDIKSGKQRCKKPIKQRCKKPIPVEEILDSEYKELVCKSNLVTEVSFNLTDRLIEVVVDFILLFVGCWRSATCEREEGLPCTQIKG